MGNLELYELHILREMASGHTKCLISFAPAAPERSNLKTRIRVSGGCGGKRGNSLKNSSKYVGFAEKSSKYFRFTIKIVSKSKIKIVKVWDQKPRLGQCAPPITHHRTGPSRRLVSTMSTMTFDVVTFDPLGVVRTDFDMCQWWHTATRHMHLRSVG